ncbi:RICIN domain-containing protein [Kribbella sp. NPDC051587]|uniref:RICIN domain-containing protein n=1 Tax=Kribbella sp. NPDC051587 TaxID=3364119 RepID=UPI0037B0A600
MPVLRKLTLGSLSFVLALAAVVVPAQSGRAVGQPQVQQPAGQPQVEQAAVETEAATAAVTARRTGKRVELASATTESRQVFVNPDGRRTLHQSVAPVRVRRGTGWVPVDTTLHFAADGTVQPVASARPLTLSGGGTTNLVALGNEEEQLRLGWPSRLPRPTLTGATATYPEVLPGVDLQVRAEAAGFAHLLVVKTRAAAMNPALRELGLPISTTGLRFTTSADGSLTATDRTGRARYTTGQALMWDAADITRSVGARIAGGRLLLRPDLSLLSAADAKFPITIDPSWSDAADDMWTHINGKDASTRGTSYWNYDRAEGAKTGWAYDDSGHIYRSLYRLDLGPIGGAQIISSRFSIDLIYTPSSRTDTYVDLYRTSPIDRSQPVTWDNTTWYEALGGVAGSAYNTPPVSLGIATAQLNGLIQQLADQRAATVTLGLRTPNENADHRWEWKKFRGESAAIDIVYNTPPLAPTKVNFSSPKPCGTAAAPVMIGTSHPSFAAVASDPDGGSLKTQLNINRASDNGVQYTVRSAQTFSGSAFAWPELPDGTLPAGTYYYTARSDDLVYPDKTDYGPSSPRCYFTVDPKAPGIPTVTSTDFPGSAVIPLRTIGYVTFHPADGDTDVAEYQYGSQQGRLTQIVKAGSDGTATVPVTVWPDPITGLPTRKLYVAAVDRAGNVSDPVGPKNLNAKSATPSTSPPAPADVNGDGRSDLTFALDQGFGRTAAWTLLATSSGFTSGTVTWDSGLSGGFQLSKSRVVTGDFDGDRRTDLAVLRDEPGGVVGLYLASSDGNRFVTQNNPIWRSAPKAWTVGTVRILAAEVTGDTKTDLIVQINTGNGGWKVMVHPGGNLSAPVQWLQTAAASGDWSLSRPVLADVDGDGKADLVNLKNLGGCRTVGEVYRSTGTGFAAAAQWYDSGAGGYCWDKSNAVAGDVDGDGKQDVVAVYDNGAQSTALKVLRSSGTAFTLSQWWQDAARFDPLKTSLAVGDYNADGKADAVLVAALDGGGREVSLLASTGTTFAAPVSAWREPRVGAGTGPKYDIETRTYELVSRQSGRCLEVAGAAQSVPADIQQWDCFGGLHQRFRIVPIAGTEQYQIQAVHVNVAPKPADGLARCFDVNDQSVADGEKILLWHCLNQGNQQVTLEYVEGSSYDTVFRLKFAHSGKCGALADGASGNGVKLVQQPCGTGAEQQFVLRGALNSPQLGGRYKITSKGGGMSLDIKDCIPASGVRTWDYIEASACQKWQLRPLGDDIYQIIDPSSNTALQTSGCGREGHAQVIAFPVDESECQRWRIEPAGDGWTIHQADTGLSLDVDGCVPTHGAEIRVWPYWNGPCQRWQLDKVG